MAINDVSLTAGMRTNLVSLQSTVDLLNRTQERLSTGKKVNSALDNPINYFTAQAHMNRASDISALKDGMNEAVQTIKSADSGIKSISTMLDSARSLAQSAKQAAQNYVKVTVGSITAGATISIGGTTYTAITAGNAPATATEFAVSTTDNSTTASNLAAAVNAKVEATTDMSANVSGSIITLTTKSTSAVLTAVATAVDATTGFNFTADTSVTSDRNSLATQYNTLMSQLDALANSSGYKGTNLLASNNLNVAFEGTTLTVAGFDATATGLGANPTATTAANRGTGYAWSIASDIDTDLNKLDTAVSKLRKEAGKLSSSLSIINVRQDFSTQMIKTLSEGADKMTLADMNEEGANMLMLQTRQSLGTTALSLSAQAAQSVLKLF